MWWVSWPRSPPSGCLIGRCHRIDPMSRFCTEGRGGPHPLDRFSSQLRWNPVHDSSGFGAGFRVVPPSVYASCGVRSLSTSGAGPVVEVHPPTDAGPSLGTDCELGQVDAFVLEYRQTAHGCPSSGLAVHRDADGLLEHVGEVDAGELAALVAIKDLRRAIALERLVQGVHAEARIERVGQGQDRTLRLAQSITATRYRNRCNGI